MNVYKAYEESQDDFLIWWELEGKELLPPILLEVPEVKELLKNVLNVAYNKGATYGMYAVLNHIKEG